MYPGIQEQNQKIGILMKAFIDQIVEFYNHLDAQPVIRSPKNVLPDGFSDTLTVPTQGRPLQEIYTEMLQKVYAHTLLAQHPRSFSCIPSTASLLSWMGDIMTNAYNPHASCRNNAPIMDQIEKQLIRWLCRAVGYPQTGGGLFLSGGSIANLTALTAARDARLSPREFSRAVIYISDQTHSSVAKGLHILGFTKEQIQKIPTDSFFSMDISALQTAILKDLNEKKKPFAVIASAGTTNTGSIDPLWEISSLCKTYGMWMHVDGAFGASAVLSKKYRKNLSGIELSDSLSWDAHKWLMQTYGCGIVLVRDQSLLVHSFAAHPEYLKDAASSEDSIEFWDLGPELTRPARYLKLWLTLQVMGSDAIGQIIDHGCDLAKLTEKIIREHPDWEILSPAQLGIVNFRFAPAEIREEKELDRINQEISREITESGFAQIFTTELRGKKALRMCTIHPETTQSDIYATIECLMQTQAIRKARNHISANPTQNTANSAQ